jgi:colanic acid/amylovoran biosynthesis glycosyltransferase
MPTVAYLANQFPVAVEPYVTDEIQELRRRGVKVVSGSVRRPNASHHPTSNSVDICLEPAQLLTLLRASLLIAKRWKSISPLIRRVLLQGSEGPKLRLKALLHTLLGACYATLLQDRAVDHIHVHHGYFGSWIAMIAARLLGIPFSLTLHGSDLLLHQTYLDEKLRHCRFCITISEYNRQYILDHFPEIDPARVIVSRLGVDVAWPAIEINPLTKTKFTILAAGRLHPVKNYSFLIHACSKLRNLGLDFDCRIAGDGPERDRLACLISIYQLHDTVTLLGQISPRNMNSLYCQADLFVLTSRSEGIPLVLMEAMANHLIVLAPAITGVPELVSHENTGYLYQPGNLNDFVNKVVAIHCMTQQSPCTQQLLYMRFAARTKVFQDFNRAKNFQRFADLFLQKISPRPWSSADESPVLQQVQLSV